MYNNNILNFQESMTILNAYTKKVWKLIEGTTYKEVIMAVDQSAGAVEYTNCISAEGYYLPNPSARAGYDTRSIFKRSLTGLNSEFSFS